MARKIDPFKVRLLQLTENNTRNLNRIMTSDIFDGATKNFHPNGLFSNEYFGFAGSKERYERFAYIDIKVTILHPLVYRILGQLKRIYHEIIAGKTYAIFDKETKDFIKSNPVDGDTGFDFFMSNLKHVEFPKNLSDLRGLSIDFLGKAGDLIYQDKVIVSPAGYRDYMIFPSGEEEEDDLNPLYRRLLGQSNAVTKEMFELSPRTYDRTRLGLQLTFNAIYEHHENMIKGKNKFLMGKVLTRQVRDGTRNVFTTQNIETKRLHDENAPDSNSTGVGLFQFLKAYRGMCLWQIQNGYLKNVFSSFGAPAKLVDKRTLQMEEVELANETYTHWLSKEGIEKQFNLFGEEDQRSRPIDIEGYWLALVYNDGKVFKIFSDINDLPEGFDKKFVSPITYAEFYYSQVWSVEGRVASTVTRFPVAGFGSIYPNIPYLMVTMKSQTLTILDESWQPTEDKLKNYPVKGQAYVNTLMPAPDKLAAMNADQTRSAFAEMQKA